MLTANSRVNTDETTGYTPNPKVTYAESVLTGGGYQIIGLKRVPVKVKASVVAAAEELAAQGIDNEQLQAFFAQLDRIEFVDQMTSFACKELYANGIYGPREANPAANVKNPGNAYLGTGEDKTKKTCHTDGYADITMYVYLDAYDGYTRGSLTSLDADSMDTLYQKDDNPSSYAENKEAGDKMAAFMDYALHFQGAKLQWAGPDGVFDTDDDVFAGNMIHKDSYFSFNHGNYIEVSITSEFERFARLGNGDYRITLISEGYEDVTVEARELKLDYKAPILVDDDIPAMDGSRIMSYQLDTTQMHVSDDATQQDAYLADLQDPANYDLRYLWGEGRNQQEVKLAEAASQISFEDGILTIGFDLTSADEVPEDIHYLSTVNSNCACADSIEVEFHYAPVD